MVDVDVTAVAWSSLGYKAIGGDDGTIWIYNSSNSRTANFISYSDEEVNSLEWNENGTQLAVGIDPAGSNAPIYVYNTSGEQVNSFSQHNGSVYGLDWNYDVNKLASCGLGDHIIKIWDGGGGLLESFGSSNFIDVAWSPADTGIIFAAILGQVKVFSLNDGIGPSVSIQEPSDNTHTFADSINVIGTISDAHIVSNASIKVNDGTPTDIILDENNSFSVNMALGIGLNTLSIVAEDGCGNTSSKSITIERGVPNSDFNLSCSPQTNTVGPGETAVYTISLVSIDGFDSSLTLSCSGVPQNTASSFSQNPVTPSAEVTLSLTPTQDTLYGLHEITLDAAGGDKTHQCIIDLVVPYAVAIEPSSIAVGSEGGDGDIIVVTQGGCEWTAVSHNAWVSVVSGVTGSGSGTISYTVVPNTDTSSRTGAITVAGNTFTVNQEGTGDSVPSASIISPSGDVTINQGESINFQATVTAGNAPFTYSWDFDGGAANVTVEDPGEITFDTTGTYVVSLTVTDDDGDSDSAVVTITVKETATNDLLVYYPFNGNTDDESGNGYDGLKHGATLTADRNGFSDSAYLFHGGDTGDYIETGLDLDESSDFTVSVWVRIHDLNQPEWKYAIDNKFDGSWRDGFMLGYNPVDNCLYAQVDAEDEGGSLQEMGSGTINANQWYHMVLVNDHVNDEASFWVDGVQVDDATESVGSNSVLIDVGKAKDKHTFDGEIDDLRIYNRILSEPEIVDLFNQQPSLVVYVSDGDIYKMMPDGSGKTRLTSDLGNNTTPALSPDLQHVVWASDNSGDYVIMRMDIDGSNKISLTDPVGEGYNYDKHPEYSPDGTKIVFTRATNPSNDNIREIFVMDSDGSNVQQLTTGSTSTTCHKQPAWSADGSQILFTKTANTPNLYSLTYMDADGTNVNTISESTNRLVSSRAGCWSGGVLPILAQGRHFNSESNANIFRTDTAGSQWQLVVDDANKVANPTWAPDGSRIIFQGQIDEPGNTDIYVCDPDGQNMVRLTIASVSDGSPYWGGRRNACTDADGDGFYAESGCGTDVDCDDTDADVNPGATEVCDGLDNNCDAQIDEGCLTWYRDSDGDGYGDPNDAVQAIEQPSGYVLDNTDGDDTDNTIYPGALEFCDGLDNDCDGQVDENCSINDGLAAYYPLNGNANDKTGNGYDGTVYGEPDTALDRDGNGDNAYSFDGTDYIKVSDEYFTNLTEFTFNIWINSSLANNGVFLATGSTDGSLGRSGIIAQFSADNLIVVRDIENDISQQRSSNATVNCGAWCMVSIVVKDNNHLKIFLNGILDSTHSIGMIDKTGGDDNLKIGCQWSDPGTASHFFNGLIDDVRIYDRSLSEQEIQFLYSSKWFDSTNILNWSGNLVADFGDNGLWFHDGSCWNWMTNDGHVGQMVVWDGKLVVDFGSDKGLWYFDNSWHWMTNKSEPNMMLSWNNGVEDILVVDFGAGQRIYTYDSSWHWFKNKDNVAGMTVWNNKLIVDFGSDRAVYNYDGSWNWMTNKDNISLMLPWDNGTREVLVVDFGDGRRIYTYDGSWNWLINKDDVNDMSVWNQKLIVDFGGGRCLYSYDGTWSWLSNKDGVARMVPWTNGIEKLGVDFGSGRGLYYYDGSWNWMKNADDVPEMTPWNNRLVVDFGSGIGIHGYRNGSWHLLRTWSTAD